MKNRAERAKKLIEALRKESTEGFVCDSILRCDGWERGAATIFGDIKDSFKFCPWCGKGRVRDIEL